MEEYNDLLKSTEAWIESTRRLLSNPAPYDSLRTLSHHASTLQVSPLRFSAWEGFIWEEALQRGVSSQSQTPLPLRLGVDIGEGSGGAV
jgi:hypothetical protein